MRQVEGDNSLRAYAAWKLKCLTHSDSRTSWASKPEKILPPPPGSRHSVGLFFFSRNLHRETLNAAELKQAGQRWSSSWRKKTRWYFLGVREHHRLVKQRKRIWGWILSFMTAETNGLYYNKNLPARCFWSGYCSLCFKTFCSYCCHLPTLTAARCAKKAFWVCGHN